jgi:hypothetical protein
MAKLNAKPAASAGFAFLIIICAIHPQPAPGPDLSGCSATRLFAGEATAEIFFSIYFRLTGRRSARFSPATDVVGFTGLIQPQTKSSSLETFKIKYQSQSRRAA